VLSITQPEPEFSYVYEKKKTCSAIVYKKIADACSGAIHKRLCTKSRKTDPLFRKMSHWLDPLPLCPCGHIKDSAQNREKLTPLFRKMSRWLDPLPLCPCGHNINFKKSEVLCTKKCGRPLLKTLLPRPKNVRTGQTPAFPPDGERLVDNPLSVSFLLKLI